MLERLQYALIGGMFGCAVGALLWWLFGIGGTRFSHTMFLEPSLLVWLKPSAVVGAVLGFLLKDKVGSIAGGAVSAAFDEKLDSSRQSQGPQAPTWLVVSVLLLIVGAVWFYLH